jgi:hypothetical protein
MAAALREEVLGLQLARLMRVAQKSAALAALARVRPTWQDSDTMALSNRLMLPGRARCAPSCCVFLFEGKMGRGGQDGLIYLTFRLVAGGPAPLHRLHRTNPGKQAHCPPGPPCAAASPACAEGLCLIAAPASRERHRARQLHHHQLLRQQPHREIRGGAPAPLQGSPSSPHASFLCLAALCNLHLICIRLWMAVGGPPLRHTRR